MSPTLKIAHVVAALAIASSASAGTKLSATGTTHGFSNGALIVAAKASRLELIDNLDAHCDSDVALAQWLAGRPNVRPSPSPGLQAPASCLTP